MANRRPLVVVTGRKQEIPAGDLVAPASLGSGTPSATNFLRGDGAWEVPSGSSGYVFSPLTTGYPPSPELIFSSGDVIMA